VNLAVHFIRTKYQAALRPDEVNCNVYVGINNGSRHGDKLKTS